MNQVNLSTKTRLAIVVLIALSSATLSLLAACDPQPAQPCPDLACACPAPCSDEPDRGPLMGVSSSTTHFTNVQAEDVTVTDDLSVTDDTTLSDDLDVSGDLSVGNGTPSITLNGEDAYIEGTFEVDGASEFDGALNVDGAADFDSTVDIAGNVSDGAGTLTLADDVLVDGQADVVQLTVQNYATPTNASLVIEDSGGTDVVALSVASAAAGSVDFLDVTDTLPALDGSDTVIGLDLNITGADHTGSSNVIYGLDLDLTTADAQADEIALELTDTDWDTGIKGALNLEHIVFPSAMSTAIITTTDGALWTIAEGEIWLVHALVCQITTNFDCTGDDCILHIGDGGDEDGLLDLDDGELQTSDTEITGAPAGWQGLSGNTVGAYLSASSMIGFIYAPSGAAETIDIKIEDSSDQSNPTGGAATCYLFYTRIQ
jgi:hypothetical protein